MATENKSFSLQQTIERWQHARLPHDPESTLPAEPLSLDDHNNASCHDDPLPIASATLTVDCLSFNDANPSAPPPDSRGYDNSITPRPLQQSFCTNRPAGRSLADATEAPSTPTDRDHDYLVQTLLGEGGMGVVYSAKQTALDRQVAVKLIRQRNTTAAADSDATPAGSTATIKQRRSMIAEATVTGNLDHPNIMPVYDLGQTDDGVLFYTMKQVRGTQWQQVITEKTETQNLEILLRVCDALAYAHDHQVVHRDLKPENIMLGNYGEVIVMDWGMAIGTTEQSKAPTLTAITGHAGTPAYMAPEMARCEADNIGPASDIYLLGAILYQILTGKPPHTGQSLYQCIRNAANNVIRPGDRHDELMRIARKAMATDPADRYPTVQIFQQAIIDYQTHLQSINLSDHAAGHLEQANRENDYDRYAQARYGFREALNLWPDNHRALGGLNETALAYASSALNKGDLDLARSLLETDRPDHQPLLSEIRTANQRRLAARLRSRRLAWASATLIGLVILILSVAFLWISYEQTRTQTALDQLTEEQAHTQIALGKALHHALRVWNPKYQNDGRLTFQQGRLTALDLAGCHVSDLKVLREFPLKLQRVNLSNTMVSDLSPLLDQPITHLDIHHAGGRMDLDQVIRIGTLQQLRFNPGYYSNSELRRLRQCRNLIQLAGPDDRSWQDLKTLETLAEQGRYQLQIQKDYARQTNRPVIDCIPLPNHQKLILRLIPPGQFVMGAPPQEADAGEDEMPAHPVQITRGFYIADREITRAQWQAVMKTTPWRTKHDKTPDLPSLPVTHVSWQQAKAFVDKLNAMALSDQLQFKLPTEAQWEYACRAGSSTAYSFGNDPAQLDDHAWYRNNTELTGNNHPMPVGTRKPNAFNLFDMHGNVWEWCSDFYARDYYQHSPAVDPKGPTEGTQVLCRGGSWFFTPGYLRSAHRLADRPDRSDDDAGFRVIAELKPADQPNQP